MKRNDLLPQEVLEKIPPLYTNENIPAEKTIIRVKYFIASFTWLVAECEVQDDDVMFYGFVINHSDPECSEWGYFTLNQLLEIKIFGFLEVERDLYFKECTYGEYIEKEGKQKKNPCLFNQKPKISFSEHLKKYKEQLKKDE